MIKRYKNARILASPFAEIFNGELWEDSGKIVYLGKETKEDGLDLKGNLMLSSFCNTHAHSAMTLFRGIADDLPLEEWLNSRIFPLEEKLSDGDIFWGTKLALLEYAKGGITGFSNMYLNRDEPFLDAVKDSGFCVSVCGASSDFTGKLDKNLIGQEEKYLKYKASDLNYMFGLHAEYTCSEPLIEGVSSLVHKYGAKSYTHLSETLKEVGDCTVRRGGLTPPQYLDKLGFFAYGGLAAHCVHVDKDDMQILKQNGVSPSINCGSNLKLGSGIPPVYSMLEAGLKLTVGTDGAASNNALSMFREMYLFSALQKPMMHDASAVKAEDALISATKNGFEALGFEKTGELKEGNFADFIVIDLNAPNMRPLNDLKKHLVYSADNSNLLMTVSRGKILFENGNYNIGEDAGRIYSECEKRIKRIKSEVV